jgi:hypothetical protein
MNGAGWGATPSGPAERGACQIKPGRGALTLEQAGCAPRPAPIPREVPVFTKCPRFAQLAPGLKRAALIVAVCAGVLVILVLLAVNVAAGLSRP